MQDVSRPPEYARQTFPFEGMLETADGTSGGVVKAQSRGSVGQKDVLIHTAGIFLSMQAVDEFKVCG